MRDPRRFLWLDLAESGRPTKSLARSYHVPQRTIQHALALARGEVAAFLAAQRLIPLPKLVLFFPVNEFTPHSKCKHDVVSLPHGTTLCCAVCHRSGMDGHPALQRYRRFEPRPEPTPKSKSGNARATRREKRAVLSDQPERATRVS